MLSNFKKQLFVTVSYCVCFENVWTIFQEKYSTHMMGHINMKTLGNYEYCFLQVDGENVWTIFQEKYSTHMIGHINMKTLGNMNIVFFKWMVNCFLQVDGVFNICLNKC